MNKTFLLCFLFFVNTLIANTPFVIGIAGGTGSGKTTLARKIEDLLDHKAILIDADSYYKDLSHLPSNERALANFDHPDSIDFGQLCQDISALKNGLSIDKPIYNFSTHSRESNTTHIEPTGVIIIEGILILSNKELCDLCDLKIFVDTDDDVRILRRAERDMRERGRSFASVLHQYTATVKPMHKQFVEPSKQRADVIIPGESDTSAALNLIINGLKNQL